MKLKFTRTDDVSTFIGKGGLKVCSDAVNKYLNVDSDTFTVELSTATPKDPDEFVEITDYEINYVFVNGSLEFVNDTSYRFFKECGSGSRVWARICG